MTRNVTAQVVGKAERALELSQQVPEGIRNEIGHNIFWHGRSVKSLLGYNTVTKAFRKPCVRRWYEFQGKKLPHPMGYMTIYTPPSIIDTPSKQLFALRGPERYWVLRTKDENGKIVEIASFTNVVEAWLLKLAGDTFTSDYWDIYYVDRTLSGDIHA